MGRWSTARWVCCSMPRARRRTGQLTLNDKDVNWRVRRTDGGLLLTVVAARALQGDWVGAPQDGRWRLQVNLREQ
jgi:hypothetical protein